MIINKLRIKGVITFFLFILVACSSRTQNKTLSLFFDGVSDPEASKMTTSDSVSKTDTSDQRSPEAKETVKIGQAVSMHSDYRKKLCEKCHDTAHSNQITQRQPDLCYQCHKKFETKYSQ